jgi:hypothetical protein
VNAELKTCGFREQRQRSKRNLRQWCVAHAGGFGERLVKDYLADRKRWQRLRPDSGEAAALGTR